MQYTFTVVVPSSRRETIDAVVIERSPSGEYQAVVRVTQDSGEIGEIPHIVKVLKE